MDIVQYTLPQRRDRIKQLRDAGTSDYSHQLLFQGKLNNYPVFTVEVQLPCYRLKNGRTRAAQLEIITTDNLSEDFFSTDPDSEPALKKQDEILRKMVSEAGLLRAFMRIQQDQPLILDNDGYIINGNRRICAMRLLLEKDEAKYEHFKHVQVLFLPPASERDIKELEGRLQVQPDYRANYQWTAEAMLYRDLRINGWKDDEIADLYKKRVSEIREMIAMLEDAEHYLNTRGNNQIYSQLIKKQYAFRQLQKGRRKCADDEPRKQLLTSVAYLMLDDPDRPDGRLYESIPEAHKFLDNIAERVNNEFNDQVDTTPDEEDEFDILGEAPEDNFAGIVQILENSEKADEARALIRDTIEEMRSLERERLDATYCFRQVKQAYTKLQSSLSALDYSSDISGIDYTLYNIEQTITNIREWLSNADNKD